MDSRREGFRGEIDLSVCREKSFENGDNLRTGTEICGVTLFGDGWR